MRPMHNGGFIRKYLSTKKQDNMSAIVYLPRAPERDV